MTGDILFNDSVKAKFGTSSDLQIYHDGSNSIIDDSGTGNLYIRSNDVLIDKYTGERMIRAIADGAVTLYHNNVEKLATASTGIDVTGVLDIFDNNSDISMDSSGSGQLKIDGNGYNFAIALDADAANIYTNSSSRDLVFGVNETEVARVTTTGIDVTGNVDISGAGTRRIDISNTTLADTGEMATLQWDNSANFTIQGRTSAGGFAANWYSIQTSDTDGRADAHIFYTDASTERMRIDASGNVGVGHTSPVAKMAILGSSNSTVTEANSNLCVEGGGGNGMLFGTLSTTGFKSYIQSGFVANLGLATYDLLLNPEGGNVGVGTASPSYKIDVRGAANTDVGIQVKASGTGDVDAELRLDAADTGESLVRYARDGTTRAVSEYTNSNEWNFTTYNDDKIDFQPNSTNVLRLTDDNIYAYKTVNVTGGVTVSTNLNVGNATPAGGGTIESHVQSSSTPALITYSGSSSLRTHISFENANGQVGKINTTGTQTFYVTSSDYRLKTDIQPMQGSIDRVKALKPCNFEWVNDGGRVDGFIAHEAQEVVPEAIVGEKDAMRDKVNIITPLIEATYDEEGNELTSEIPAVTETEQVPDYQGIDQSKIVPLLTSALQDAIAKIEALETRLTALES
jgi:hypothetical protein